jgi:hypothetical protein
VVASPHPCPLFSAIQAAIDPSIIPSWEFSRRGSVQVAYRPFPLGDELEAKEEREKQKRKGKRAKWSRQNYIFDTHFAFGTTFFHPFWGPFGPLSRFIDSRDWLNQYCVENFPLKRRISGTRIGPLGTIHASPRPKLPHFMMHFYVFVSQLLFPTLLNAFVPLPSWPYFPS